MFPVSTPEARTPHADLPRLRPGRRRSPRDGTQFLPLILIFGVFYFLLIRPQQQKAKEMKATLSALRRGDRVVTAGGILGVVQRVKEGSNEIEVEIAPNVRVTVLRETIGSVIKPTAANDVAKV